MEYNHSTSLTVNFLVYTMNDNTYLDFSRLAKISQNTRGYSEYAFSANPRIKKRLRTLARLAKY